MAYQINYTPVSEHDFVSLAAAHDAMDKHIRSPKSDRGIYYCQTCHLPLTGCNKIEAPRGNKGVSSYNFNRDINEVVDRLGCDEYVNRVFAFYLYSKSFPMLDYLLGHYWRPSLKPLLYKYFMPEHRAVSAEYARLGLWVATKENRQPTDETRGFACLDPECGLEYALQIDKGPHAATRAAACRRAELSVRYAREVDKAYNISTFSKALQAKATAFDYLDSFHALPEVRDAVLNVFVKPGDVESAIKWAHRCGGNEDTKRKVLEVGSPAEKINYSINIHKQPDDELRASVLATGVAGYALRYAQNVDDCPREDTRAAACMDALSALDYARYVDRKACDATRNATLNDPHRAFEYAILVDKKALPETRVAASKEPSRAVRYAKEIDGMATPETMAGASKHSTVAIEYAERFGPSDITRAAACRNSDTAYEYARDVDQCPRSDTREAASYHESYATMYASFEEAYVEKQVLKEAAAAQAAQIAAKLNEEAK